MSEPVLVQSQVALSETAFQFSLTDVLSVALRDAISSVRAKLNEEGLRRIRPGIVTIRYEVEAE